MPIVGRHGTGHRKRRDCGGVKAVRSEDERNRRGGKGKAPHGEGKILPPMAQEIVERGIRHQLAVESRGLIEARKSSRQADVEE